MRNNSIQKKHLVFLLTFFSLFFFYEAIFSIEIMTFNIQKGGKKEQHEIIEIIKKSKAEIIGINEAYDAETFKKIADELEYHSYRSDTKKYQVGLLSKYPITEKVTLKDKILSRSAISVKVKLNEKQQLTVFVVHLKPLNFPSRKKKRKAEIEFILKQVKADNKNQPIILMGDFNERSHLDKPHKNKFVSKLITAMGFTDAFRKMNASVKDFPGFTQSAKTLLIKRIDFIYGNKALKITASKTIGKKFHKKWPSDHKAVLATISLK